MKATLKVIGLFFILMLCNEISVAQDSDFTRIGNIDDEIMLDKYESYYLITYEDINMDSKGELISFKLKDKEATTKLYQEVKNSLIEKIENPTIISFEEVELRVYYKGRKLKADHVEIVHEDLKTETTGTLPWLNLEELEELFGNKE